MGINRESIGYFHMNQFLNTQEYRVELSDVSYHELNANQIVEDMF